MKLLSQEATPVIFFLLLITLIAYALYPICFSLLRKKTITSGRYDLYCYIFNFFVHFIFYMNGSKSQTGPYMLWTFVFTIIGCNILKKRGLLRSRTEINQSTVEVCEVEDNAVCKEPQIYNNAEKVTSVEVGEDCTMSVEHINTDNRKDKKAKVRICKFCGSQIDTETKKCSGCGKQYFKGIKFNKYSITVAVFSIVLLISILLNFYQFIKMNELKTEITNSNEEITKEEKILDLFDRRFVFVEDDGTLLYHKYDCYKFKGNRFRVFGFDDAKEEGYRACPICRPSESKSQDALEQLRKEFGLD